MTLKETVYFLENEKACILYDKCRNTHSECESCPLVKRQEDIIEAFNTAIAFLKQHITEE